MPFNRYPNNRHPPTGPHSHLLEIPSPFKYTKLWTKHFNSQASGRHSRFKQQHEAYSAKLGLMHKHLPPRFLESSFSLHQLPGGPCCSAFPKGHWDHAPTWHVASPPISTDRASVVSPPISMDISSLLHCPIIKTSSLLAVALGGKMTVEDMLVLVSISGHWTTQQGWAYLHTYIHHTHK